jgi:formylglycine-generating enzyme required for sulfatase activity/energy-coupling factor transporter ATP-binding protein EcfA2
LGSGVLPDEQIEATLEALRIQYQTYLSRLEGVADPTKIETGGGAAVLGDVDTAGGDFIGRDKIEHIHYPKGTDPKILRQAYLNRLIGKTSSLSLAGIDPKAASDAQARLDLSAVYTALLTYSAEQHQRLQRGEVVEKDTRRLSALEQLNRQSRLVLLGEPGSGKSTFVNFVALCLAGEALGRQDANLAVLTAPLPPEEESYREREEPAPQPWDHGALLPVRVILRDFAAAGLPEPGQPASTGHLWEFISRELEASPLEEYVPHLRKELLESGGLIMLDGLDEVPDANLRRAQIRRVVEDFTATFQRCRVLITSRTYAYQPQDWRLPGFTDTVLAPFSRGQIRAFVDRWYAHIASPRGLDPEDAQGRAELLKRAIFNSERLGALAERPLILTLMASLHAWRGGSLPEKREQLYADTVDLLLDWWESQRVVRDAEGNVVNIQPSLAEWLKIDRDKMRELLNQLAYQAHASQPDLTGTANIAEKQLVGELMHLSKNPDVKPARLVEYLSLRAGLLVPHGEESFTFPHRTFQEYLAACYLTDYDYPDQVAELAREEPNRWREVALLAGAKAVRGTASAIWSLVEALCYQEPTAEQVTERDLWGAHLGAQALVESADLAQVSERNRIKIQRLRRWLVHILESNALPAVERARAGDSLAQLGDPRFDSENWYLPREPLLGFVHIPAGPFRMGSDPEHDVEAYEDEQPEHEVSLPAYFIARYPVTVAQFRAFVDQSGYQPREPASLSGLPNHPVVRVTWYDAIAYSRWLTEQLRAWESTPEPLASLLRDPGWRVSLPSEAEWEKAARGGLQIPVGPPIQVTSSGSAQFKEADQLIPNPNPARLYPWGEGSDPEKANFSGTGIGTTSTVGCFPSGASPYGLLDMPGNVREWTRSIFREYPYQPGDGRESLEGDDLRVLRGGAFLYNPLGVRCAVRSNGYPDYWYFDIGCRVVVSPSPSDL